MAEEKKLNKKWFIVVAILVLIAIIVVTIILCLPGNPGSAVVALQNESTNALLKNSDTSNKYSNLKTLVENSEVNVYSDELADIETVLNNIDIVVDEYAEQVVLFELNDYFYNHYKPLTNSLNELQTYKNNITNQLQYVEERLDSISQDFLRESVIIIRENFANMLNKYETAFYTYNDIFKNSYPGFENNLAMQTILNAVADYVAVLSDKFDAQVNSDTENTALADYKYSTTAIVDAFNSFINAFQRNTQDAVNYYFDTSISAEYQTLNSFYNLYSQTNLKPVISSAVLGADNNISFTLTFEGVEDSNDVYGQIKNYLGGE